MAKKQENAVPTAVGEHITVRIPVARLAESGGYCESRSQVPRELRSRRLTPEQGTALAMVRLGMVQQGEVLGGRRSTLVGGRYEPTVSSKEEAIARLLEFVFDAINEQMEA